MRRQIRDAAAAALLGLVSTGANVFKSRSAPTGDGKLPALLIYTRNERSQFDGMGEPTVRPLHREVRLWVVAVVRSVDEPDDLLDQICAEAEAALMASVPVAALLENLELVSTEFDVPTEGADKQLGRAGMTWRGTYRTAAGNATAPA